MQDVSAIAVLFQAAGSILLGIIIGQLARIFSSRPARWWSAGWLFFAAALISVRVFIDFPTVLASVVYLILEWMFLFSLWCGCCELAGCAIPPWRRVAFVAPFAVLIAIVITWPAGSFNQVFIVEAAIMALCMFACVVQLSKASAGPSVSIMRAALALFAALYAAYVPLFSVHEYFRAIPLLSYSSFADLLTSTFVGCAMVLVIADAENRRTKDVVSELEQARSVIEQRLHTDALTEALSRHAFYSIKQGAEVATDGLLSGVVVMIDIDNLKLINDTYGHDAGDTVIRAVANALRSVIRADDLLFRWGGDEFVAVLPNISASLVAERLATFRAPVRAQLSDGRSIECHISCGSAEFESEQSIDEAIRIADQRMYERRRGSADESPS